MKYKTAYGDCIKVVNVKSISLLYMEPPHGPKNEDKYHGVGDSLHEYLTYMYDRITHVKNFMSDDCNVILHSDCRNVHNLKIMMDNIFGRESFRSEIVWKYSKPSGKGKDLVISHDNLLWYGTGDYVFNSSEVFDGNSNKNMFRDYWDDISAVLESDEEYPTEKPLELMDRIVSLWSNKGQKVFDPFMGSGAFLESSVRLERLAVGVDIDEKAVEIANKRLETIEAYV